VNRDSAGVGRGYFGARGYGCEMTSGEMTVLRGEEQGHRDSIDWNRPIRYSVKIRFQVSNWLYVRSRYKLTRSKKGAM
jgi:hypothetical protein